MKIAINTKKPKKKAALAHFAFFYQKERRRSEKLTLHNQFTSKLVKDNADQLRKAISF